ncbi:MAG: hypothetical protein Kow0042_02020 [Calditrichia bacterium]
MYKKLFFLFIRIVLGMLFIIAAYGKLLNPQDFAINIENYRVLGEWLSRWIAVILPPLELIVGIMLIAGVWLQANFIIALLLYLVFDIMIFQAYLRGLDISCGCFSTADSGPIDFQKISENIVLTALTLIGFLFIFKGDISKKEKA